MRQLLFAAAAALSAFAPPAEAQIGRQLDFEAEPVGTQFVPSQNATLPVRPVVGIFWDERCAQVEYTFNSNVGANPGTPLEIAPADLAAVVQDGLDRWNANPASFIEMNVTAVEDLGNRPRVGGDFINEVTFITPATFTALASSPSTALTEDMTFRPGDDIDEDGDSDVFNPEAEGLNRCADVDGDGDIEFPAGFYRAGTILDNDVQFASFVTWELDATSNAIGTPSLADVDAVSTHEFGHSHGINHSLINQISEADGTGATMFPFIDTSDSNSELGSRSLSEDDLAVSSFIYPEGSGVSGLSALQPGDEAFDAVYDVVRGEVFTDGAPVAGAFIGAIDRVTGELISGSYSGRTQTFEAGFTNPGSFLEALAVPESVVNGAYEIAVPRRRTYIASLEALDGDPANTFNISTNAIIAGEIGQNAFPEELQNRRREASIEFFPDQATPFFSGNSTAQGLDFLTNEESVQSNAGPIEFIGTGLLAGATSVVYAEVFDRDEIDQRLANGDVPISGNFRTGTLDASLVPVFDRARLAFGVLNADGTATITQTIDQTTNFVGQDGDSTPFVFNNAKSIPFRIRRAFNRDPDLQVFLVLEADSLTPGPSGFPPNFLALDGDVEGTSYQSFSGSPLALRAGSTWSVELRYVNDGSPVAPFLTRF